MHVEALCLKNVATFDDLYCILLDFVWFLLSFHAQSVHFAALNGKKRDKDFGVDGNGTIDALTVFPILV